MRLSKTVCNRRGRPHVAHRGLVRLRLRAGDLLETGPPPRDLLVDKGFNGAAFTSAQASRATAVLLPPAKGHRHRMPPILRKIIAEWRNRIETTFKEIG